MPLGVSSASTPATHISTASGHSSAARRTPSAAATTDRTMMRLTPHSLRVCMAAAQVPPVAMTGSTTIAKLDAFVPGSADELET
ncbi:hypothetical protein PC116_g31966 [Phytophthora cactorum]|nr:hypothetical protein PC116_g31966 [Phytophthora cactorum]